MGIIRMNRIACKNLCHYLLHIGVQCKLIEKFLYVNEVHTECWYSGNLFNIHFVVDAVVVYTSYFNITKVFLE